MYYLSVGAIFKNESHILSEWLQHYLSEGVDHFYLIDNGSNDNYMPLLERYIDDGTVTLFVDSKPNSQIELYNKYFIPVKQQTEWILICDLDEFMYSRHPFDKISNFLHSIPDNIGCINVPWKMFTSSGYIDQPKAVVKSFTTRAAYTGTKNPGMSNKYRSWGKTLLKSCWVSEFDVHTSSLLKGRRVDSVLDRIILSKNFTVPRISEKLLEKSSVHLNHYSIQSFNWFMEVKAKRGDVSKQTLDNWRNVQYFETYDHPKYQLVDTELATKKYLSDID